MFNAGLAPARAAHYRNAHAYIEPNIPYNSRIMRILGSPYYFKYFASVIGAGLVKTDLRNRMNTHTLDQLLRLCMEAPEVQEINF